MQFYNCDCMKLLEEPPDKYYELAIIDPPYGIENKISIGGGGVILKVLLNFISYIVKIIKNGT